MCGGDKNGRTNESPDALTSIRMNPVCMGMDFIRCATNEVSHIHTDKRSTRRMTLWDTSFTQRLVIHPISSHEVSGLQRTASRDGETNIAQTSAGLV